MKTLQCIQSDGAVVVNGTTNNDGSEKSHRTSYRTGIASHRTDGRNIYNVTIYEGQ